jgi:23S rRNA (cytosine1962-C5)-methyltransferase
VTAPAAAAGYELLDCGGGRRLERFGAVVTDRPAPQAAWPPGAPAALWGRADLVYDAPAHGRGAWRGEAPAGWQVACGPLVFELAALPSGQVGLFPEQQAIWTWLGRALAAPGQEIRLLNGFAYTGGSTLAAAAAGAAVTHVDAARSAVQRARRNAELSGLAAKPVRWLVEEIGRFAAREVRRGRAYHGVVLDPPAFGRGPKGRTWKLARDLPALLETAGALLPEGARLAALTCHDPALTPADLGDHLARLPGVPRAAVETGPLVIPAAAGHDLPAGAYARWCVTG